MAEVCYTPAFVAAFAGLLTDEGGYVSSGQARAAGDAGGETKYGISKREYPDIDIASLTEDDAEAIYWRDFWTKFHFERLPDQIAAKMLSLSVVMGPGHAIKCLQDALDTCGALHLNCDGVIGAATIAAAH